MSVPWPIVTATRNTTTRTSFGLACAVVPVGIIVHLIAEALALGSAAATSLFVLRHIYLVVPLILAAWAFGTTIGLNGSHREMVRRCALARADLRGRGNVRNLLAFVTANFGFFCFTQLIEGIPIASGDFTIGIFAALLGAAIAAVAVFVWGRRVVRAALIFVTSSPARVAGALRAGRTVFVAARCASNAFTLFIPNRPPPRVSFV
jgi:hypothetical protein